MACLNMFNNDQQQGHCSSIPRISFSSDFADSQHQIKHENIYREPPVSSEFKFSAPSYGMICADELFSKGKLLPLKEHCTKITTLKDELLVDDNDDEYEDVLPRLPKGSGWWKERLGLKRAQIVPKKADKSEDLYANKTGPNWWSIGHEGGEAM